MQKFKTGLMPQKTYKPSDWQFNGASGIINAKKNPGGQWDEYLPPAEYQWGTNLDTMACVTFSALNCIETLLKFSYNENFNGSDRFLAKISGTTKLGNSLGRVADSIRQYGLVQEQIWGWDRFTFDWGTFYQPIPSTVLKLANLWLEGHLVQYEWVEPDVNEIVKALVYAPLQVTITYAGGSGIIPKRGGDQNHAVMLYGYEYGKYWKIFDHYEDVKKKLAWDYTIFAALKYNVLMNKPMSNLYNNTLYQCVEGAGGFGLSVGEKFYVDDLEKLIAVWMVRNNGDTKGKVGVLKQSEWDALIKFNLKNEQV